MRKLLAICMVLLCACEPDIVDENLVISQDLTKGETWVYNLGNPPVDGGFSIKEPPLQAIRSEILWDLSLSYIYQPMPNYTGKDKVVILKRYTIGDARFRESHIIIEFTIR